METEGNQLDIDSLKMPHESEIEWGLRRSFLFAHQDKFPKNRLLCLASCFVNFEIYGNRYPDEVMTQLQQLTEDIKDEVTTFREKIKERCEVQFVKSSNLSSAPSKETPTDQKMTVLVQSTTKSQDTGKLKKETCVYSLEGSSAVPFQHMEDTGPGAANEHVAQCTAEPERSEADEKFYMLAKTLKAIKWTASPRVKSPVYLLDMATVMLNMAIQTDHRLSTDGQSTICSLHIDFVHVATGNKSPSMKKTTINAYFKAVNLLCKCYFRVVQLNPEKGKLQASDTPFSQPKALKKFVILERKYYEHDVTPVDLLRSSADFCQMNISFQHEIEGKKRRCVLKLEGQVLADVHGTYEETTAESVAAEQALKTLHKICYTIQLKKFADPEDSKLPMEEELEDSPHSEINADPEDSKLPIEEELGDSPHSEISADPEDSKLPMEEVLGDSPHSEISADPEDSKLPMGEVLGDSLQSELSPDPEDSLLPMEEISASPEDSKLAIEEELGDSPQIEISANPEDSKLPMGEELGDSPQIEISANPEDSKLPMGEELGDSPQIEISANPEDSKLPMEEVLGDSQQSELSHFISDSNIGKKILKKMGWTGGGLGKNCQGITEPVSVRKVIGRAGVGMVEDKDQSKGFRWAGLSKAEKKLQRSVIKQARMAEKNGQSSAIQQAGLTRADKKFQSSVLQQAGPAKAGQNDQSSYIQQAALAEAENILQSSVLQKARLCKAERKVLEGNFLKCVQSVLLNYTKSDNVGDLAFSSEFDKKERSVINQECCQLGLTSQGIGHGTDRFMIVTQELNVKQTLAQVMRQRGRCVGLVIPPRGRQAQTDLSNLI